MIFKTEENVSKLAADSFTLHVRKRMNSSLLDHFLPPWRNEQRRGEVEVVVVGAACSHPLAEVFPGGVVETWDVVGIWVRNVPTMKVREAFRKCLGERWVEGAVEEEFEVGRELEVRMEQEYATRQACQLPTVAYVWTISREHASKKPVNWSILIPSTISRKGMGWLLPFSVTISRMALVFAISASLSMHPTKRKISSWKMGTSRLH